MPSGPETKFPIQFPDLGHMTYSPTSVTILLPMPNTAKNSESTPDLRLLLEQDTSLVKIASNFKILTMVEWPKKTQELFLDGYRKKNPKIPEVSYKKYNFKEELTALDSIIKNTNVDHPIAKYLNSTAKSYFQAHQLIENLGLPEMTKHSLEIYGQPSDLVAGSNYSSLDAAKFFIQLSDNFKSFHQLTEEDTSVTAETIRDQLEKAVNNIITEDTVSIFIDENLVPKAAAGVNRVRLRSGSNFSKYDFKQLLEHEIFVHSLTAINGRRQPNLTTLSLGSPRTTATQEGLATFAELATGSMDLNRLKRIALRVVATDKALHGANFIEIFEYFLKEGQSEQESYSSTQRIFRGGDPNGDIVFTKDTVYLDGLLRAHSFFRWAMKNSKLSLTRVLFAGRLTFDDTQSLAPFVDDGFISPPKYLPPWIAEAPLLGGYLAFSLFANKIRVGGLDKEFGSQG